MVIRVKQTRIRTNLTRTALQLNQTKQCLRRPSRPPRVTYIYGSTSNQIHFLSLNVCGLKSKILCPEFLTFVAPYDIIGIQESKLDDVDSVSIPGYKIFSNNRARISRYRSGGIAVLVKNELLPFITIQKIKSKLISWFSVSKQILPNNDDLHCGIVCIPPYRF